MAYGGDVFCEIAFLKKFRDATLILGSDSEDIHRNVLKFILKSNLKLDIPNKKALADCYTVGDGNGPQNDLIYRIAEQFTRCGSAKLSFSDEHKLECEENLIAKIDERGKYIYLLDEAQGKCESYRQKYGVVVISPQSWSSELEAKKYQYLFMDCGSVIQKNEKTKYAWNRIIKDEYNLSKCNSIVIIDNYLNLDRVKNLLEVLLPTNFDKEDTFYISFFIKGNIYAYDSDERYKRKLEQINKFIKHLRPMLKVEVDVNVFGDTETFHDRCILTNNAFVKVGAGFDCIDERGNAKKLTEINIIHPYIQSFSLSCADFYEANIRAASKVVNAPNNLECKHYPKNKPCSNRLIVRKE